MKKKNFTVKCFDEVITTTTVFVFNVRLFCKKIVKLRIQYNTNPLPILHAHSTILSKNNDFKFCSKKTLKTDCASSFVVILTFLLERECLIETVTC